MSSLRDAVRPYADHPVVRAGAALWADLPRVLLLGSITAAAAGPAWVLLVAHAPVPAVVVGWLLLGPAWVLVIRSVADITRSGRIRLPARDSRGAGRIVRDGLALAAPPMAGALCTLAALSMEHGSTAAAVVRALALTVDLAACGTIAVLLPAVSALAGRGDTPGRRAWATAANLTGAAPLLALEVVALAVLLGLLARVAGGAGLLPVLLLGAPVLATVVSGVWPGDGSTHRPLGRRVHR